MPPLLAVAYLEILRGGLEPGKGAALLACVVFSVACVASYGHVINDIFDVEADRRAGKCNHMADATRFQGLTASSTFLCLGFAPALIMPYSIAAIVLLTLNYLWPTLYSFPATRLKERGLAGVICDALGSHLTPTLLVIGLLGVPATSASDWFFLFAVTTWAAVLGVKGILHHQIIDRAGDIQAGTITFATRASTQWTSRFMRAFNLFVEMPASATLAIVVYPWAPLVAYAFIVYCTIEATKYRLGFQFALTSEAWGVRPSLPFTNEAFYVFWLPVAASLQMALDNPLWIWVPALHAVLFHATLTEQANSVRSVLKVAKLPHRLWRRNN
jgi:4-hydroxybenzoate polyprenyltransferase